MKTRPMNTRGMIALLACAGVAMLAAPADAGRAKNQIRSVDHLQVNGSTTIAVHGSQTPTFSVYKLRRPERVVIDVANATLRTRGGGKATWSLNTWAVGQVSAHRIGGGSGSVVRIVIGMARPGSYKVNAVKKDLIVKIIPRDAPPPDKTSDAKAALQRARAEIANLRRETAKARRETAAARRTLQNAKLEVDRARSAMANAKKDAEQARSETVAHKRRAAAEAQRARRALADAKAEAAKARREATQRRKAAQTQLAAAARKLAIANKRLAAANKVMQSAEASRKAATAAAARAAARERAARSARLQVQQRRDEAAKARRAATRYTAEARRAADTDRKKAAELRARAERALARAELRRKQAEAAARVAELRRKQAEAAARAAVAKRQVAVSAIAHAERKRAAAEKQRADAIARRARAESERARAEGKRKRAERAAREAVALAGRATELRRKEERAYHIARRARLEAEKRRRAAVAASSRLAKSVRAAALAESEAKRRRAAALDAARHATKLQRNRSKANQRQIARARAMATALNSKRKVAEATLQSRLRDVQVRRSELRRLSKARDAAAAQMQDLKAKADRVRTLRRNEERVLSSLAKRRAHEERQLEIARKAREKAESEARAASQRTAALKRAHERELQRTAALKRAHERELQRTAALKRTTAELERSAAELKRTREREARRTAALKRAHEAEMQRIRAEQRAAKKRLADLRAQRARLQRRKPNNKVSRGAMAKHRKELAAIEKRLAETKRKLRQGRAALQRRPRVSDVDFVDKKHAARVVIALSSPSKPRVLRRRGRRVMLEFRNVGLDQKLERTLDTTRYRGPVRAVSSYRSTRNPKNVRVVVDLRHPTRHKLERVGNTYYWNFVKPQKVAGATPSSTKRSNVRTASYPAPVVGGYGSTSTPITQQTVAQLRRSRRGRRIYRGAKIDLDFKDADIHNLLRLLADVGRVNIVVPDDIRAKITVRLRRVPWDQALEVILASKGLWYRRDGNLYRVAPRKDLDAEDEAEAARIRLEAQSEAPEPEVFTLNYADAKDVSKQLKPLLSPKGKIEVNKRTNSMIINDLKANRRRVIALARRLDTQTPQIQIEARIVEARTSYQRQIGVQWGGTLNASQAGGNATGLIFPNSMTIAGAAEAAPSDFAVSLPAAVATGSGGAVGFNFGSVGGNFNLGLRLSALEDKGTVRVVSAPKITVINNETAQIKQGTSVPIAVPAPNGTGVQTTFVPADLELKVTPKVSQRDCSITMQLDIKNNEIGPVTSGGESILRKETKTTLLIADGETTVLGGIYTRNTGISYSKVPFFGDLPVVGWFFKNRRESDERAELLIFVTPKITNKAFLRCE